jgi:hypothetical protein
MKIFYSGLWMVFGMMSATSSFSFCGFYVAKASTDLFNNSSKVVFAREGKRSVISMSSDYEGDAKDFALIIPVPTVLKKKQIHVAENALIEHLDAYTSPRLVEYHDKNPCRRNPEGRFKRAMMMNELEIQTDSSKGAVKTSVKIEAQYTVEEYDILILSATESNGLLQWLNTNGYKVPNSAQKVVHSYIKQGMKFFIAKVNIKKQAKLGLETLRPIQIAFESEKFMLPIRLGTINSKAQQEMFVFTLTSKGRVETSNYRTVKLPSNVDMPIYIKEDFGAFYKSLFSHQVKKENNKAVFLEYAWDMSWCDPCAADPLSPKQLKQLGVMWLGDAQNGAGKSQSAYTPPPKVFVTRLHLRYNKANFPEDLKLHETSDSSNFQSRYVLRHAWKGEVNCKAGKQYKKTLPVRFDKEAQTLSNLTGWDIETIRKKMKSNGQDYQAVSSSSWWEDIWN